MNIGIDFDKFQKRESVTVMTNFTRTPNFLVDAGFMASMSGNAFKCLHCILRQTTGFNRNSHNLPENLIRKTTGIKNKDTFYTSIRELEQLQLITVSREKGKVNTYSLNLEYSEKLGVVPNISTPENQDYSTQENQECSTPKKQESLKETLKENIKEIHTQENPNQNDDSWKPNLDLLTSILRTTKHSQRVSEILGMVDFEFHLGNFNAHWEDKILLTENQKTRKFVSWITQEFEKSQRISKAKPATPNRNVNDAWGEEQQYAPASDIDCGGLL